MKMNMKIVEAQGYSKVKAFETTNLDTSVERLKNATISWKKAGAPLSGKALQEFFEAYIKDNRAFGAYVVVEQATDDTRERPYKVVNVVAEGTTKFKTVYQVVEAEHKVKVSTTQNEEGEDVETYDVKVVSYGAVAGQAVKKDLAIKLMKDLIKENKRGYTIRRVKVVEGANEISAHGIYTPSKSAEVGKFIFAVAE